jgi:hypothetical protein
MKVIKSKLSVDNHQDGDANGKPDNQASQIDSCMEFIPE